MSLALLFPGQGTQHPAMLGWLESCPAAAATLALVETRLGSDWRTRLSNQDWAGSNRVAQILLTGLGLAAWECLRERLSEPSTIAGYSIGEIPAFCAAGVFDVEAAIALACERADAMELSVAGHDTGLLAVTSPDPGAIERACRRHGLAVAILLSTDRWVLGGLSAALNLALVELSNEGARCNRLAVKLASHTPWTAAAATDFARRALVVPFARNGATLVCNLTGAAVRGEQALRAALAGQIAHPVQWSRCMQAVAERRPRCVLEVGPGSTLSRLWNERFPSIPARSVDEFRSPQAVAEWVSGTLVRG